MIFIYGRTPFPTTTEEIYLPKPYNPAPQGSFERESFLIALRAQGWYSRRDRGLFRSYCGQRGHRAGKK